MEPYPSSLPQLIDSAHLNTTLDYPSPLKLLNSPTPGMLLPFARRSETQRERVNVR